MFYQMVAMQLATLMANAVSDPCERCNKRAQVVSVVSQSIDPMCMQVGFTSTLSCASCDELLPRFKLDVLHEQCTACCRTDTDAGAKVCIEQFSNESHYRSIPSQTSKCATERSVGTRRCRVSGSTIASGR